MNEVYTEDIPIETQNLLNIRKLSGGNSYKPEEDIQKHAYVKAGISPYSIVSCTQDDTNCIGITARAAQNGFAVAVIPLHLLNKGN